MQKQIPTVPVNLKQNEGWMVGVVLGDLVQRTPRYLFSVAFQIFLKKHICIKIEERVKFVE